MTKTNKRSFALLCALLMITGANVFAQKVDFSGKWKLEEKKSDFGKNGPQAAAPELTLLDNEKAFTIERGWADKPLSYDGKISEVINDLKFRRTKMITRKSVKRTADGQSIIIIQKQINDSPETVTTWDTTEIWTLSADKNELTIKQTGGQKGVKPDVMIFVYSRQ